MTGQSGTHLASDEMRPARLRKRLQSNSIVLPALVCAGFCFGLAGSFWNSGGVVREANARSVSESPSPFAVRGDAAPSGEEVAAAESADENNSSEEMTDAVASAGAVRADPGDADLVLAESSDEDASEAEEAEPAQVAYYAPDPPGAPNADERASAIQAVDTSSAESASASVAQLQNALTNDRSVRNRLLAINSLRALATQEQNLPRVREILRTAMSDSDGNVATSARDAYQELAR